MKNIGEKFVLRNPETLSGGSVPLPKIEIAFESPLEGLMQFSYGHTQLSKEESLKLFQALTPQEKKYLEKQILDKTNATAEVKENLQILKSMFHKNILQNTELLGANLSQLQGTPHDDILVFAKYSLNITDPLTSADFARAIKKFQKENGLDVDGKLGADTYIAMLSLDIDKNIDEAMKENAVLSSDLKKNILFISQNPRVNLKNLVTQFDLGGDIIKLEQKFGEEDIHKEFFIKLIPEARKQGGENLENNPSIKKDIANLKETKQSNGKTFYENIVDGNYKDAFTNPNALLIGGLLFLFGVVGGKKFSFMQRVGILLGVTVGGKMLGADKMLSDIFSEETGDAILKKGSELKDYIQKSNIETQAKTQGIMQKITGVTIPSEFSLKFGAIFGTVSGSMDTYNESLNTADKKANYITPTNLIAIKGILFPDETFLATKTDKISVNTMSDSAKSKIAALYKGDSATQTKELTSFIENHMKNTFDSDTKIVGDLFYTIPLLDLIKKESDTIIQNNSEYISGNSQLNTHVLEQMSNLAGTGTDLEKEAGQHAISFVKKQKEATFTEADITTFLATQPNISAHAKDVLTEVAFLYSMQSYIATQSKELGKIKIDDVSGSTIETKETISDKITTLYSLRDTTKNKIQLDFSGKTLKLKNKFNTNNFESDVLAKEEELLKKAEALGVINVGAIVVVDVLGTIDAKKIDLDTTKEIARTMKELDEINLGTIPSKDSSPADFEKFLAKNKVALELAKKISTDSNSHQMVQDKAREVLKKLDTFKLNAEKMHTKMKEEVETLDTELNRILTNNPADNNEFKKESEALRDITKKYFALEVKMRGYTATTAAINNFDFTQKSIKNAFDLVLGKIKVPKNYLQAIDNIFLPFAKGSVLGTISNQNTELNTIKRVLSYKELQLKSNFKVEVDPLEVDVSNIMEFTSQILTKKEIISQFGSFEDSRIMDLKTQVSLGINQYIKGLKNATTYDELLIIKEKYNTEIHSKLSGTSFGYGSLIIGERFEDTYKEKANDLFKTKIETSTLLYLEGAYPDIYKPINDFKEKYKKFLSITRAFDGTQLLSSSLGLLELYNKLTPLGINMSDYNDDLDELKKVIASEITSSNH